MLDGSETDMFMCVAGLRQKCCVDNSGHTQNNSFAYALKHSETKARIMACNTLT